MFMQNKIHSTLALPPTVKCVNVMLWSILPPIQKHNKVFNSPTKSCSKTTIVLHEQKKNKIETKINTKTKNHPNNIPTPNINHPKNIINIYCGFPHVRVYYILIIIRIKSTKVIMIYIPKSKRSKAHTNVVQR